MENDKKAMTLLVIHSLFTFFALGLSFYNIFDVNRVDINTPIILTKLCSLLAIAALLFGFIYFLAGYKKNAYLFYRVFMIIFALEIMFTILIDMVYTTSQLLPSLCFLLMYASIIILAIAKDFGKVKSKIVSMILVVCSVVVLVFYIIAKANIGFLCLQIDNCVLAGTTALMVAGKYYDKDLRGTK